MEHPVKGNSMKSKDLTKQRQIHKVDLSAERSEDDRTSDTDAELTLHKATAVLSEISQVSIMQNSSSMSGVMKVKPKIEGRLIYG